MPLGYPRPMYLTVVLAVLTTLCSAMLATCWLRGRRRRAGVDTLRRELQRAAIAERPSDHIDTAARHPEALALARAINDLLARASIGGLTGDDDLRLFRIAGDHVRQTVLVHTDVVEYANPHFAALLGTGLDALIGRRLADLVRPDESDFVEESLQRRLRGDSAPERFEVDLPAGPGQSVRLELSTTPIDYGSRDALLVTGAEVIPGFPAEVPDDDGIRRSPMRDALDSLAVAVLTSGSDGLIDYANPAACRLFAAAEDLLLGRRLVELVDLVDETDRSPLEDPVGRALESGEPVNLGRRALVRVLATSTEHSMEVSAAPIRRGESSPVDGCVLLLNDVTEVRGIARQMSYQATHDALTGLVNRQEFLLRLQDALDAANRGDSTCVLCYIDLDRFKTVNDGSGHIAGDTMLREVAKIMRKSVRDSDTVARLGGDEFALLLSGCPLEKAGQIAAELARRVGEFRFIWKERSYSVGASCGLVEIGAAIGDLEETMAAADSACYVAKRKGTGQVAVYSATEEAEVRRNSEVQWLQMLQTAIRDDQFRLYAQPIVAAGEGARGGPAMELLIRLVDSAGGDMLLPSEFLRAAERYRLMNLIDRWVVQAALTAVSHGGIRLPEGRSLAINIAGQTLGDEQFLDFVVECFDTTGVDPSRICFELAESSVVEKLEPSRRFVDVLHGMGCKFALDDFGSNFGTFQNLKSLRVDYLKIDGSFIRNIARDVVSQAMVGAMIKLARSLDFEVIAEHVEDQGAIDAVRTMGVDYLQGFAIGRPRPLRLAA
ncbi:MAG: hypothetical protein RLZZ393_113 [Pseudomonadota bacterium]